ncbi:MAG: hypothetical protein ACOY3P_11125 [Planctomycetota bacterium]
MKNLILKIAIVAIAATVLCQQSAWAGNRRGGGALTDGQIRVRNLAQDGFNQYYLAVVIVDPPAGLDFTDLQAILDAGGKFMGGGSFRTFGVKGGSHTVGVVIPDFIGLVPETLRTYQINRKQTLDITIRVGADGAELFP